LALLGSGIRIEIAGIYLRLGDHWGFRLRQDAVGALSPSIHKRVAPKQYSARLAHTGDERRVHVEGPDTDRIVLVGHGATLGQNVSSHEFGLAGHLARKLFDLTGRGASVDTLSDHTVSANDYVRSVSEVDLGRYDILVLMIGASEGRRLLRRLWRRQLIAVLDRVHRTAPSSLHVFVIAVPSARARGGLSRLFALIGNRQMRALNSVAQAVCRGRDGVTAIAFTRKSVAVGVDEAGSIFDAWAALVAPSIHPVLDRLRDQSNS
jgi:hypothetical protein